LLLACALPAGAERHRFVPVDPERAVSPRGAELTHRIPLQIVILQGSRWTWDAVSARTVMTKEVLAQCGVRLDPTIVTLAAPSGRAGIIYAPARSQEPDGMATIVRALSQPKPTLFYVDAFVDNTGQGGTSRILQTVTAGQDVPEVDTAWIPYFDQKPSWQVNYHVDAHELVHVLADVRHWSPPYQSPPGHRKGDVDPNAPNPGLMSGNTMNRTNIIDPYLCERIKRHSSAAAL
jgi:hypothetical protein